MKNSSAGGQIAQEASTSTAPTRMYDLDYVRHSVQMALVSAQNFVRKSWWETQGVNLAVFVQRERMIEQDSAQMIDSSSPHEVANSLAVIAFVGTKLLRNVGLQLGCSGSVHRLETHHKTAGFGEVALMIPDWHGSVVTLQECLHASAHQRAHHDQPGESINP